MLHLLESHIRNLIGPDEAWQAVREAFAALARGEVHQPPVIGFDLTDRRGEIHLKGAYIEGQPCFSFKIATGFYDNPDRGLPTGSGLVMVFDAWTGFPAALLQDNGYLTEMRTAAAGALACQILARPEARTLGLVGAGTQARYQLRALANQRELERVVVWSRSRERLTAFIEEMSGEFPFEFTAADSPEAAVSEAGIVITATPSREPLIPADALHAGQHLTCMGSDQPGKQELDPAAFRRIDRIYADHIEQAASQGELQHAIAGGVIGRNEIAGTLGEVLVALKEGRVGPDEITFCDLTGTGVQDAAIASLTVELAREQGVGATLGEG
jgi:ornithine cyclodeaminase